MCSLIPRSIMVIVATIIIATTFAPLHIHAQTATEREQIIVNDVLITPTK